MAVIVAVMDNPGCCGMGLHYFDETDWPADGYTEIRRITGTTAAELRTR